MRLAILGADEATVALARAALAGAEHELSWVCELSRDGHDGASETLLALARHVKPVAHWESLLDGAIVDAVIVARAADEDRRADQLRKFVQAGVPLLVSHPAVDSMLVYYELDMIRRETGCVMLPYLPGRWHPAIVELTRVFAEPADSPIGKVEQVIIERRLAQRTKSCVLADFARDVDLIRAICGDVTRIGAMGAASDEAAYANLGVQMSGPGGALARWSVGPSDSQESTRLLMRGSLGQATLVMPPSGLAWNLEMAAGGKSLRREFADWDPAQAALDRLAQAVAGQEVEPLWIDAARSVELAETIDRSLRKGRTIELYYEDYTEEGTFKGTMTSLGCGLLLAGLGLLLVVGVAGQLGLPYVDKWPYLLLGVLGIFLLLQLLMLLFHKDKSAD